MCVPWLKVLNNNGRHAPSLRIPTPFPIPPLPPSILKCFGRNDD